MKIYPVFFVLFLLSLPGQSQTRFPVGVSVQNITGSTNLSLAVRGTNGALTGGVNSNATAWLFPDGSVTVPSLGWLSDNDGTGAGLMRPTANGIGIILNGAERFRFVTAGDTSMAVGSAYLSFGASLTAVDAAMQRDAPGTIAYKQGGYTTNRSYRTYVNAAPYASGFQPTNAAWLESGFDGVYNWSFIRSMADGSNQTTQPLVLGIGTNGTLRLETNGAVTVPALKLANAISAPAFTTGFGAHLWSDGTNLCIVLVNSAGTRTTNKVTMSAWP